MAIYVESGVTSNDLVVQRNSVTVFDGGIVSNTTINEFGRVVLSGGSADNTTINSGGNMHVQYGGTAVSTTVNSGGSMVVTPNEIALEIKENGGYVGGVTEASIHRGNVSFVSNTISGLTLSGTSRPVVMTVHSNTVADSIVIGAGGMMDVYASGVVKNTTIHAGGSMRLQYRAFHRGTLQIESGAVVSAMTGAIIDFDIINRTTDDGYMINDLSLIQGTPSYYISVSENQAAGTYKLAQGAASFDGTITIAGAQGSSLGPVTINGDNVVYNGVTYSLDQVDGNLTLTVIPKPAVFIYEANKYLVSSSYEMTGAVIDSNYTMHISSGGVANDTTINTSARAYVLSGGVANGTTVNAQGTIIISSCGVANDTTVNSTGGMHLVAGTASNTTVSSGGRVFMSSGAIHRGTLQLESGAAVHAFYCIIDFTVAGRTVEDGYLINDLSLIRQNPVFTITVSENQAAGTYKLAQGASSFSHIAISIGTEDTVYGSITVNGSDFVYDGIIYSLDQVNGDLTLTIAEEPKVFIYDRSILISSGRTVTSAIMGNQTQMHIFSGGTANSTAVTGGSMHIFSGGTANKTHLDSGCVYVSTGGIANDTVIRRGVLAITYGGTANDTIMSWGNTSITSGGVANGTNMSGGWMYISGVANDTTVNASGNIDVAEGGVANDTTINTSGSMIVFSGAVANGTTLNSGYLRLSSGAVANGTTLNSGGDLWLSSGAVANDTTLNSGGGLWLSSGAVVNDTIINSGGALRLEFGAVANDTTLNTYGYMSVENGGVANRTTINTSGSMTIFEGGVANDTVFNCTTGNVLPYRGFITISSGGVANNTIVVNGLVGNHGGTANNTTLNNNGSMGVDNGGVANNTTINAQGQMVLFSGGVASDTIVNASGCMYISSGGVHRGTLQIENNAIISAFYGSIIDFTVADRTFEDDYLINNLALIHGNRTFTITVSEDQALGTYKLAQHAVSLDGKTILIRTEDTAYGSVTVNGPDLVLANNIAYSLDQVNGNLTLTIADLSSAVVIYNGGELVSSGAMISGAVISGKNNVMEVTSGGTASDTTINFRGNVYAYDGGYVVGTVVNSMGNLILENAIADSSVVNSGGQLLTGPNTVINHTDVNGGKVYIYDTSCVASDTVVRNGGTLAIEKGSALNTEVANNGVLLLSNGAVAKDTMFADGGIGAVLDDGVLSSAVISGGALTVSGGGSALDTTIASNGYIYLADNGLIQNLDIQAGGTLYVLESVEKSIADGVLTVAGKMIAENDVTGDYSIVWSLAGAQPGDEPMVEGLSHFAATGFSVTVSADQAEGTYSLANGCSSMENVVVKIEIVESYSDSIIVNGAGVVYNGLTYSVSEVNGDFTLFIGDITPPDKPVVEASTTAFTNQDVTLAAAFTEDSAVKQYKIGNGEWQEYTGAVTVTENATIYFRAADKAGNVSDITEYVVSNIDRIAPDQPTAKADITTITNQDVTLTAAFTEDSAVKQYKIGNGEWQAYTGAITVAENATIYFRAADAAGNISEVTEYVVGNIDKVAPDQPTAKADITTVTNKDVTVIAAYSKDSVVKQYKIGNGDWQAYTGAITVEENATIYFRGADVAGNVSEITEYVVSNIDKVAPTLDILGNAADWTNKDVTLTAVVSDGIVEYFDGSAWVEGTSLTVSENGTYLFRATDAAGNVTEQSVVVDKIDKVAPTLKINGVTTDWTNKDVTLSAVVSDGVVEYFDGSAWVEGASLTVGENGTYLFRVTDAAGNVTEQSATVGNIDKVAPTVPELISVTNVGNRITVTHSGSEDNGCGVYAYTIQVSQYEDFHTLYVSTRYSGGNSHSKLTLSDGTYYVRVKAEDYKGNESMYSNVVSLTIDTTPPEKPEAGADITSVTNKAVTVTASFTDDTTVMEYSYDNQIWKAYTGGIVFEENGSVYFRAQDAYGNISDVTEYVVSNIDKVAPLQPTADADIKETTYDSVTITATFTEDSAVKQYKIGDGEWMDYTGAVIVSENATVYFRALDEAGNISDVTGYVVDNIIKSATLDGSGMTHADAIAAGCELIVTTDGTYKSNIGHDGVEARIEGGTFNCTVSGGALTSTNNYMTWDDQEADTNLSISGGTFNKVVMGGDRVNRGNCEHIGDLNLTINGGNFNSQIVGGMAYTDQSIRGQALLTGDINMTLAGGTFKSRIYGGCISTANYSTRTAIDGNINIVVDSSENELIFADNVYIVAGSYQSGAIYGNVQVTFTGLGENLKMDADNLVWGGSSSDVYLIKGNTRTFQSTIDGTRTICFNNFTGEFNTGIRGFNIFTAENGSKLEILASNHLRDIEQWNLDWDTQLSGSFLNDFTGDTMNIDLEGWNQTATNLFDCAAGTFTGFEAMKKVTIGGETAKYSEALSAYVSTNYMLTLRDNQTMQLSMNTTIA